MIRVLAMILCAGTASADTVVATRTLPANSLIGPNDIALRDISIPGAADSPDLVIGMEAKVALFSGRPIALADLRFPAVVERNQVIPLIYRTGSLHIATEGRALDRAGPGDVIRVMNLASRNTVIAQIGLDGAAHVSN